MYPSTYGHFSSGDLLEPRNTTPGDDASLGRCQRTNQKNEKKRNRKRKRSQVANDGNLEGKSSIRCRARSEVYSSARWSLWLSLHFETEAPPQIRGVALLHPCCCCWFQSFFRTFLLLLFIPEVFMSAVGGRHTACASQFLRKKEGKKKNRLFFSSSSSRWAPKGRFVTAVMSFPPFSTSRACAAAEPYLTRLNAPPQRI